MKLNSTLGLTLMLLVMMLGAGSASAWWGYTLGYEALKSVTQPDVNPAKKLANSQNDSEHENGFTIVEEEEILMRVNGYMQGSSSDNSATKEKENTSNQGDNKANANAVFPQASQDGGVTLEVSNTTYEKGSLLLNVNLKNEGPETVQFLYSLLDITDESNRNLSGITEGLPRELPANGESFSGTIRIPLALLDDAKVISLTLPDYPKQQVNLKIAAIPVKN